MSFLNHHTLFLQCVQKPNQQVQDPGSTETLDTKELKLQDEVHKQLVETLGNYPSAHRAKRVKCEVGVFETTTHTFLFYINLMYKKTHFSNEDSQQAYYVSWQ